MIVQQAGGTSGLVERFAGLRGKLRFSMAMAIIGANPEQPTGLDDLCARMVAGKPPKALARAQRRVDRLLGSPAEARMAFGPYGAIPAGGYRGADHAERRVGSESRDRARLRRAFARLERDRRTHRVSPAGTSASRRRRLCLYLNAVRRLDDTGPPGSGAFAVVGAAIDTEGTARRIAQVTIAENFEAGEARRFVGDGRLLHEWALEGATDQPNACAAMLCAVGEDEQGFADLLPALWREVSEEVVRRVADEPLSAGSRAMLRPITGGLADGLIGWFGGLSEDRPASCVTVLGAAAEPRPAADHITGVRPHNTFSLSRDRYQVWCSLRAHDEPPAG
ncbi:MAG: hypothetical protein DI570_17310 [Phenylobacterium zucineum]|nr:MAG: hypothetical protein DI570_17310 [Phenylobacterium zucineum]